MVAIAIAILSSGGMDAVNLWGRISGDHIPWVTREVIIKLVDCRELWANLLERVWVQKISIVVSGRSLHTGNSRRADSVRFFRFEGKSCSKYGVDREKQKTEQKKQRKLFFAYFFKKSSTA